MAVLLPLVNTGLVVITCSPITFTSGVATSGGICIATSPVEVTLYFIMPLNLFCALSDNVLKVRTATAAKVKNLFIISYYFNLQRYTKKMNPQFLPLKNKKIFSVLYPALFSKNAPISKKKAPCEVPFFNVFFCGKRGIRTPGPVKINGFQDRRIRPLCHLSECKSTTFFETTKIYFQNSTIFYL